MRHSSRNSRRRRRKAIAKSASLATLSFLSLSLTGAAAADRSFFIFDNELSRMPGLRLAQVKRGGARRGVRGMRGRRGMRAMPGMRGLRGMRAMPGGRRGGVTPGSQKRRGLTPGGRSGFMLSVPALDGSSKDPARK
jgi:hypothetical protein